MDIQVGNHVRVKVTQEVMDVTHNKAPQTFNSNSPMVVVAVDDETGQVTVRRESSIVGSYPYQYLEVVPEPHEELPTIPPEFILP